MESDAASPPFADAPTDKQFGATPLSGAGRLVGDRLAGGPSKQTHRVAPQQTKHRTTNIRITKLSTLVVAASLAAAFVSTPSARAEISGFYVGIDSRATLASGVYVDLPNPNFNRLTFLYPHVFPSTPANNHYHGIGSYTFRIGYHPDGANLLTLTARNEDLGVDYPSNQVILVVRESSRLTLPPGTPFGDAGAPLWILPQSQNVRLLYLGVSAEAIPTGVFDGALRVELKRFDGPGYFMAWQATGPGQFNIRLNSRDGLTDADAFTPITGSHEHFNWGFSSTGVFSATFQATGRRFGETTNLSSAETTFVFHVLPLPPPTNFLTWQRSHWPPGFNPPTTEPTADPDADGSANLLEYAAGTSPTNALQVVAAPALSFLDEPGGPFASVTLDRYTPARDLRLAIEATSVLSRDWQPLEQVHSTVPINNQIERLTLRDPVSGTNGSRRFYRLKADLF